MVNAGRIDPKEDSIVAMDAVREIRRAARRKFRAEEKIKIVLEGLRVEIPITELSRRVFLIPRRSSMVRTLSGRSGVPCIGRHGAQIAWTRGAGGLRWPRWIGYGPVMLGIACAWTPARRPDRPILPPIPAWAAWARRGGRDDAAHDGSMRADRRRDRMRSTCAGERAAAGRPAWHAVLARMGA